MNLTIKNLSAGISGQQILNKVDLLIKKGKIHALMGPNGSGKSTLAQVLMGHPAYQVMKKTSPAPSIKIGKKELLGLSPDKRANLGLFLAFQNPVSVPGVSVANLLRTARSEKNGQPKKLHHPALNVMKFHQELYAKTKKLGISGELLKRGLNEDFSGGEKKKLEMLQAEVLSPRFAIFDEIDTGLDVDALKTVARQIALLKKTGCGILLITHYLRILKYTRPDKVFVMIDGRIIKKGGYRLARQIETKGYKSFIKKSTA